MIECAAEYTIDCVERMILGGYGEIEVKKDAQDAYVRRLDAANAQNAWQRGEVTNWYTNEHGRGSTNWAWSCSYYWWLTKNVCWSHFALKH